MTPHHDGCLTTLVFSAGISAQAEGERNGGTERPRLARGGISSRIPYEPDEWSLSQRKNAGGSSRRHAAPDVRASASRNAPNSLVNIELHNAIVTHLQQERLAVFLIFDVNALHDIKDLQRFFAKGGQYLFPISLHHCFLALLSLVTAYIEFRPRLRLSHCSN